MRRRRLAHVSLVGGVAVGLLWLSQGVAQVKIPADFAFDQGKDSPGPVTFSHEIHKAKVEKCPACHVKIFKMKKGQTGPLVMAKMNAGEQCGVCHNGKTKIEGSVVFAVDDKANCEKCHKT